MIQQTSLLAFYSLKGLGDEQRRVYEAIKKLGAATDRQLAKYLGKEINCITPRRGELVEMKLVGEEGLVMQDTGRKAMAWSVREPNDSKLKQIATEPQAVYVGLDTK